MTRMASRGDRGEGIVEESKENENRDRIEVRPRTERGDEDGEQPEVEGVRRQWRSATEEER